MYTKRLLSVYDLAVIKVSNQRQFQEFQIRWNPIRPEITHPGLGATESCRSALAASGAGLLL
jgi:hypothetical protein